MIVSDVITRVRSILNDNAANDGDRRWTDASLVLYVAAAQRAILDERPDFRLSAAGVYQTPAAVTAATDAGSALMVPGEYEEAMAAFVAHLVLTDDNSDSNNAAQAAEYFKRYERLMISPV